MFSDYLNQPCERVLDTLPQGVATHRLRATDLNHHSKPSSTLLLFMELTSVFSKKIEGS